MKISIAASRVLTSLGVVAVLSSSAMAASGNQNNTGSSIQTITTASVIDSTTFKNNFKESTKGNWQFNNVNADLTLGFDATQIREEKSTLNNLDITANKVTITEPIDGYYQDEISNSFPEIDEIVPSGQAFSFNINAKQVIFDGSLVGIYKDSNIVGDATFQNNALLSVIGHNLNIKGKEY